MRNTYFLVSLIFVLNSCNYFSNSSKKEKQEKETAIDFSSIDKSPSFPECDAFVGEERTQCFINNLQEQIASTLSTADFTVDEDLEETVYVYLLVNKNGTIELKDIEADDHVFNKLPSLDSLLQVSVKKLPVVNPAEKSGFSVTTQYKLPIKISVNN